MIIIESYDEYKKQVKGLKSIFSNCYLMPQQIKQLTETKKLYLLKSKENIFLLQKENTFYRIYYFITQEQEIDKLYLDRPAVIEYPYQGEFSAKSRLEEAVILKLGFTLGRNSARMHVKAEDILNLEYRETINMYSVCTAQEYDAEAVEQLLLSNFNPLFSFLPDRHEILNKINAGHLFTAYQNTTVIGALNMDIEKETAWLRHLIIRKQFRGQGVGRLLLNYYLKQFKNSVQDFRHWVDSDNKAAIGLYENVGFRLDGRKAKEYILYPDY